MLCLNLWVWVADHSQMLLIDSAMSSVTGSAIASESDSFSSQNMYNMIWNQVFAEHNHQKKIWNLTQVINQQNAEMHQLIVHNQQIMNANEAMTQQIQSFENAVSIYKQNWMFSDDCVYMKLQHQLTIRNDWQQCILSKYLPLWNNIADFLTFFKNIRYCNQCDHFPVMKKFSDHQMQFIQISHRKTHQNDKSCANSFHKNIDSHNDYNVPFT